jgi:hypothetical protein
MELQTLEAAVVVAVDMVLVVAAAGVGLEGICLGL